MNKKNPNIHIAQMYNCASMMVICELEIVVISELGVGVLNKSFLKIEIILFLKSNQKVIDLVV